MITIALSNEIDKEWNIFKMKYSKQYQTKQEEYQRKQIFQLNYNKLLHHNKQNPSYIQGINYYSDYGDDELLQLTKKTSNQRFQQWKTVHNRRQFHLQQNLKQTQEQNIPINYSLCTSESEYNYCGTLVIDQGNCGCCYAAGVAHQLSTLYSYHLHHLNQNETTKENIVRKLFSVQQLIDCNSFWGGCGGGFAEFCLDANDKFVFEEDYPFIDATVQCDSPDDCKSNRHECKTQNTTMKTPLQLKDISQRYTYFSRVSWEEIKQIIYKYHGFISAMKVSPSLYRYSGGIYKDASCQNQTTDHVVVVDGYGESGNTKYLWVRNSWGKNWGIENGHFKIDFDTLCGINNRDIYGYQNGEALYIENNFYFEVELTDEFQNSSFSIYLFIIFIIILLI